LKKKYQNGEQYYNRLYLRFNASIAVGLLPMAWLLLEKQSGKLTPLSLEPWPLWVLIGVLLFGALTIIAFSIKRFKKGKNVACEAPGFREKLDLYFIASLRKYLEFLLGGLICVAGMWITGNTLFLVGYLITLILLSLGRPTLTAFMEDLKLTKDEQSRLLEKKEIE